jgi:hypothetical protein
MGFALMGVCGASLASGFDIVAGLKLPFLFSALEN